MPTDAHNVPLVGEDVALLLSVMGVILFPVDTK